MTQSIRWDGAIQVRSNVDPTFTATVDVFQEFFVDLSDINSLFPNRTSFFEFLNLNFEVFNTLLKLKIVILYIITLVYKKIYKFIYILKSYF